MLDGQYTGEHVVDKAALVAEVEGEVGRDDCG